jgi:glycosyltransferase involved in cell wall biosynthesis
LLVLPSHAEGVPVCISEAHSQGVPLVAKRVGGIPDVIAHGVQGWLVPPDEPQALAQLLQQPVLRAELAHNAQAATQSSYAVRVVVQQVEAIYREVLEQASRAGMKAQR